MTTKKIKPITPFCTKHGGVFVDDSGKAEAFVPITEGTPINGREVVSISLKPDENGYCEMATVYDGRPAAPAQAKSGPAQVSTPEYRDVWNAVFGKKNPTVNKPN